jgi:hypothetical protein
MNARMLLLCAALLASAAGCAPPPDPAFRTATDRSLDAMLDDPLHAARPARPAPRLAARRDTAFQHYAKGEDTAAHRSGAETASVSGVGKAGN